MQQQSQAWQLPQQEPESTQMVSQDVSKKEGVTSERIGLWFSAISAATLPSKLLLQTVSTALHYDHRQHDVHTQGSGVWFCSLDVIHVGTPSLLITLMVRVIPGSNPIQTLQTTLLAAHKIALLLSGENQKLLTQDECLDSTRVTFVAKFTL